MDIGSREFVPREADLPPKQIAAQAQPRFERKSGFEAKTPARGAFAVNTAGTN
jgi:hypothetical protein